MLQGNVLITGGAGYLGRGIMRRAKRENWPARFFILSRDETKQHEASVRYPDAQYILGDVTDITRLYHVFIGMHTVIHAAAIKYIPEGELNADECIRVNIDGARTVRDAAVSAGVDQVIGISTDKAAQPINVYGMTKAVMERLFAEAGYRGRTRFNTVRYGNVIGSTGSVVPVMRRQLMDAGCVKITDPYMTRFWMTVDEAIDTILMARDAAVGATVVPNPRASSMLDIAYAVLGADGQSMRGEFLRDDRLQIIGKRPGEKQHEDLISHYELYRTTDVNGHYEILPPGNENYTVDRPTLSSNEARMIDRETLRDMIIDSETV